MTALHQINDRFQENLTRVDHLLKIYEETAPGTQGRQPVERTDLLRSAVVFLHASLEDFIRSLAECQARSSRL